MFDVKSLLTWCREVWFGLWWLQRNYGKVDYLLQYLPRHGRRYRTCGVINRPYLSYTWDGDPAFWWRHTYMIEWKLWYANRVRGPVPTCEHRRYWQKRLGR